MSTTDLDEIEKIRQLKYRYFRALDQHDWESLAACLTSDCAASYDEGKYSFAGSKAIVDGIKSMMDRPTILTMHHGHHPEIALAGSNAASGTWYLEDCVIDLRENVILRGTAFYSDEYQKTDDGQWKIKFTGYKRVFETVTSPIPHDFQVTTNMFARR